MMKKILFFLLLSMLIYGQKTETIGFSKPIKNNRSSTRSLTVIDQRENQEVGMVTYHDEEVKIAFEKDASTDIKDWFYKYNPVRGSNDMILLLEKLSISEEKKEKYSIGKIELRASIFSKKMDGYHFVYRKDTVATVSSRVTPYLARNLAKKVALILTNLFKESYEAKPWEFSLSENDLPNYGSLLPEKLAVFNTNNLKEGVYKDYYSFFTQKPEPEFILQTNNKGIVTKAVKGEENVAIRNFYAFVHGGVAYKTIPFGYKEISKNHDGIFIEVSKKELFPETATNGAMIGAITGGLVGGVIGAVIDASISSKRNNTIGPKVYLDSFTGNYILPENFDKTK